MIIRGSESEKIKFLAQGHKTNKKHSLGLLFYVLYFGFGLHPAVFRPYSGLYVHAPGRAQGTVWDAGD